MLRRTPLALLAFALACPAAAGPVEELAAVVAARGPSLAAADLAGFFDPGYLKDGFGPQEGAAECATLLRGARAASVSGGALVVETASGPVRRPLADDVHTLCSLAATRHGPDGRARLVGNGLPARALAHASLARRHWGAPCPDCAGPARKLRLLVSAPPGSLAAASAAWPGGRADLRRSAERVLEVTLVPARGRTLDVWTEHWTWEAEGEPPPAGTEVSFELTTSSGARARVTRRLPEWPTAAATVTAPTGHRLADARLGKGLLVSWSVPEGFVPAEVELVGLLRAGGALCEVDARPRLLPPALRSAVMPWKGVCGGVRVRPAGERTGDPPAALTLQLTDAEGRTLEVVYAFW